MEGWISLHRKMIDWEWYNEPNTIRLFLHCLLKANHQDKKWRGIDIKRGSFVTSYAKLADELELSIQNVRTALNNLKLTGEVTSESSSKNTVIKVVNYDKHQVNNTQDNTQSNKQLTKSQHTPNTRLTTTNNDNNDNNDNNENKIYEAKQNYKPEFNSFFSKVNTRFHQDWITEVFNDYKSFSPNCENTIQQFIDGTMKYSILEFCKSCKYNSIKFFNETAAINYWKQASKGYISDVDVWRDKLKAMKKRSENQLSEINL